MEAKNVSIGLAAAITSYARIHMMDFKLNNDVIYSDTDSVILGNNIDSSLIGPELGQMKDELNGEYMSECYILGIKQYGYHYKFEKGLKDPNIPLETFEDFYFFFYLKQNFRSFKFVFDPIPKKK